MKYFTLYACLLAWVAIALLYLRQPAPQPHYTVKHFCEEHPDICSHERLAKYGTPSPIPRTKGYVLVYP